MKLLLQQEEFFLLIENVLFKMSRPEDLQNNPLKLRLRMCIPEKLAEIIIANKHEAYMGSGHHGYLKSLHNINSKFYINDLGKKLREYVSSCGTCLKLKKYPGQEIQVPLQRSAGKTVSRPWERIQLDHCGPFKSNKYSSRHLLVVVDEFSNYVRLFPCDSTGSVEVVQHLIKLFRTLGIPSATSMLSDRGPAFRSEVSEAVSKAYGIQWTFDRSSSPWESGLSESMVKITKNLLKNLILKRPDLDVFDVIQDVQYSMNTCPQSESGLSAHFVHFGWEPKSPLDFTLDDGIVFPKQMGTFAERLEDESKLRHELVKQVKDFYAQRRIAKYNARITQLPVLKEGDLVLLSTHSHPLSSKSSRKFKVHRSGPYTVLKIDGHSAILADAEGNVLPDLISQRRLSKISQYRENFPCDLVGAIEEVPSSVNVGLKPTGRYRQRDGNVERLMRLDNDRRCTIWLPDNYVSNMGK